MSAASAAEDPRIERTRQRVLVAALEELGEAGYGAFAMEQVAARSGVAKSTIYRHWSGKLALVADAFRSFHREGGPDLATGSPRERLVRIVAHVAEVVATPPFSVCIPALIDAAARDASLAAFHHAFQAGARAPLDQAVAEVLVADGRSPAAAAPIATALLGAIFYARLMTPAAFDPANAESLVDALMPAR